jgi:transposase
MTAQQTAIEEVYVGVDAHKKELEVMLREMGELKTVANTPEGRAELCEELVALPVVLIVVEASGGVEREFVADCVAAGLPIAVINPTRIRSYAKACGVLAKTDAIDAQIIADFAATIRPKPQDLRDELTSTLDALIRRRTQISKMLTAERNRYHTAHTEVRERIQEHITWLKEEKEALEAEMLTLVAAHAPWQEQRERTNSVPGVGDITSLTLMAQLPELGKVNRQEIAALAGLAPYNHDSAGRRGQRRIYGGRSDIRSVLYMATLSAIHCKNPVIHKFYEHLIAQGKPAKVALTACMRKLLTILNAMVRDKQAWRGSPSTSPS